MNAMPIVVFSFFVAFVLWLSFFLSKKAKSADGFFAAGGTVPWGVNGISFAGDYLSAASFLGICGLIATKGYDGFLYSIGFLAGWIVALFIVAEPMKKLGKYTFTDALDAKFNSKGIQLIAAISTLVVSMCYLIPQMVGAGSLVTPLLGLPHWAGVWIVGAIVIFIVATAGMASTTYVQFLKGGLLIIFSTVLVVAVCKRGLTTTPEQVMKDGTKQSFYEYKSMGVSLQNAQYVPANPAYQVIQIQHVKSVGNDLTFIELTKEGDMSWWVERVNPNNMERSLHECQWITKKGLKTYVNGKEGNKSDLRKVGRLVAIEGKTGKDADTGALGPFGFLSMVGNKETKIQGWTSAKFAVDKDTEVTAFFQEFNLTAGDKYMRPGGKFKVSGTLWERIDFVSLMLALFFGTAALPHILIRYYTVPSPACARKSTIVAIAAIGFFYVLTLFIGVGATVNGAINPADGNMSAPLLAKTFSPLLFAIISAIAFATVLGTVSGLIIAASGAVAHDLMGQFAGMKLSDRGKVFFGKTAAVVVGLIAIILGVIFEGMNVGYLVGWAFAVAASANLPAILMLLFWKKTTAKGIATSIVVGMVAALTIILLSPDMYVKLYKLPKSSALISINQPGIISIPLAFITLIVVSLMTQKKDADKVKEEVKADRMKLG